MKKLSLLIPFLLLISACRQENASVIVPETPAELLAVFQSVPQEDVSNSIPQLRETVQPGDDVTFNAKVMGSKTPFVTGRALMVVGDENTMTSCDLMSGDDHCETPWDVCCEDPKMIQKATASVQVVDAEGRVLSLGLQGVKGLKELSRVRIKGTVAPMSTAQSFIVNAQAIEVLP